MTTKYFSGQGKVYVGAYTSAGAEPGSWTHVGNVSDLKISIATSVVDHKESMSGFRTIDLRLYTEVKTQVSITMESFSAANLVEALQGTSTVGASTTSIEALTIPANMLTLKFEGLNTADSNSAVTVRVYRFMSDPLKELTLISDTIQKFMLEGIALYDESIVTAGKSKYFTVTVPN